MKKILLIEDDRDLNTGLTCDLELENYRVCSAFTLGEGMEILTREEVDLILLDGGDAQVHAVLPVLAGMHIDVPVFGMVKDSKHRTRAISTGGGEIQINANRQSFTLVSSIQEEVHRFAVSYHHQKHKKSAFNSTLLQIEGIGPAKAKALLKTLKTVTAVREATQEQLAAVPGISQENAKAVYAYYHGETAAK